MSIDAYRKTAAKTESPRQIEFRAFALATRSLIEAKELPAIEIGRRAEALARNRRLWTLLAADCADDGNQLPAQLRAQIVSLSIFVDRQTRAALRQEEGFDILIDINRTIMQGLAPQPATPSAGVGAVAG